MRRGTVRKADWCNCSSFLTSGNSESLMAIPCALCGWEIGTRVLLFPQAGPGTWQFGSMLGVFALSDAFQSSSHWLKVERHDEFLVARSPLAHGCCCHLHQLPGRTLPAAAP